MDLHQPLPDEAPPVMMVQYLFYDHAGEKHVPAAKNVGKHTLIVRDDMPSVLDTDIEWQVLCCIEASDVHSQEVLADPCHVATVVLSVVFAESAFDSKRV